MFKDLEADLENFYDLPEQKQEEILSEINQRGSKTQDKFKAYLKEVGYGINTNRSLFYEAIWKHPKNWEDFILEELEGLIKRSADGEKGVIEEFTSLIYLTDLEEMSPAFYKKSLSILWKGLDAKIPEVRGNCSEAIIDIIEIGEIMLKMNEVEKLQELLKDEVFKIRMQTYSNLKEINLLPKDFKFSVWDRIRAKLTGYGKLLD
ncbi:MAG: hypothetical protein R2828_27550 [Saprospiraceae bacterium]